MTTTNGNADIDLDIDALERAITRKGSHTERAVARMQEDGSLHAAEATAEPDHESALRAMYTTLARREIEIAEANLRQAQVDLDRAKARAADLLKIGDQAVDCSRQNAMAMRVLVEG